MQTSHQSKQNAQKTVKAFELDIALINDQAKAMGCSAADIIHEMCVERRKEIYLQELGESFDLVCANPELLASFAAVEQKLWDYALNDGLDNAE